MKMLLPVLAKRLLSFALALVLLLSLCPVLPLTADAANYQERWQYSGSYSWLTDIYFASENATNVDGIPVFENDKPYDWKITVYQARTTVSITAKVTIIDENGDIVGSSEVTGSSKEATKGETSVMFSASEYHSALSTDLAGTFTLTCKLYYGASLCGTLTQTFRRIIEDKNASFDATSRSNPDMVFTYADPIDLVLHIEKTDGVEESFYAATTITNTNGEPIAENIYFIPSSTNIDVSVKDMVPVTNIKTPGNYSVNVALYSDISAPARYTTTIPFAVVAMDRTVTVSITGSNSFAGTVPNLTVNAHKDDGVTEYCTALVTVTDTDTGSTVYSNTFEGDISGTSANPTKLYPNLDNLPIVGNFRMDVVVKDSEGITRSTASKTFSRTSTSEFTANLDDNNFRNNVKTGLIYTGDDNPLALTIDHPSSANKTLTIRYTGTYNGETLNETRDITMPSNGKITLNTTDFVKYGIYEDLHIAIYRGDTLLKDFEGQNYSFSLVRAETAKGGMPLLNMNVHYTHIGKGEEVHMTNQVDFSALAGASAWRSSITWDSVEKVSGVYAVPKQLEAVMDQTKAQGMKALIILAYNNNNSRLDSNGNIMYDSDGKPLPMYGDPDPYNSTWLNAYANYCESVARYMAENYPNQVIGFEIWNEWNHATMSKVDDADLRTGAAYAEVVKAASARIRAVNEEYQARGKTVNFMVIGGATAGSGYLDGTAAGTNVNAFMNDFFNAENIIDAIDGFSFHTYASKETTSFMDKINKIRRFVAVNPTEEEFDKIFASVKARLKDADKEIWLTETSWSTFVGEQSEYDSKKNETHITTGVTEQQQAAYMTQLYAWALTDGTVDRIFWYDLLNDRTSLGRDSNGKQQWAWSDSLTENNYGVLHTFDESLCDEVAYAAKQGYVAMCAMSSMLGNASYSGEVELPGDVAAYSFIKDGKTMVVAWTTTDTTATLNCSSSMTVTDMFGNATSGLTSATLSECPIYIECDPSTLSIG